MKRLDNRTLERSPVVSNSRMNRERGAVGVNSYEKDLGLDPIDFLRDRLRENDTAAWLDLCCGRGRALIDAATALQNMAFGDRVTLHGVDLVDMFDAVPTGIASLQLESASLHQWDSHRNYDLITCVHGLHYIGDKLSLVQHAINWLTDEGVFVANLDMANLRLADGKPLGRELAKRFHDHGLEYNRRRHIVSCVGAKIVSLRHRYVGADDTVGPNYSGQEAVNSYYEPCG